MSETEAAENMGARPIDLRRLVVFALSVILSGLAISFFCLDSLFVRTAGATSIFPDALQEDFFFDLFGFIGGCWLLSFVGSVNMWKGAARFGQWLGLILLSVDQVILLAQWQGILQYHDYWSNGLWLVPSLLQVYFLGLYFGFFTLPALTQSGNRTLTGLATLAVLLPWLIGREAIIWGTRILP